MRQKEFIKKLMELNKVYDDYLKAKEQAKSKKFLEMIEKEIPEIESKVLALWREFFTKETTNEKED